jgi:S-DNA-T family DNA segregation ATPase FtsK/SpoIIIE
VVLLFVLLAFLGIFYPVILENVGFGIVLVACWIVIVAALILKRRVRALAKWWNFWAGALLATLAIWGILSLFSPDLTLGDVSFSQVSLGGTAGASFIGTQGVGAPSWLRLTLIVLASVFVILPYPSLVFVKRLAGPARIAGTDTLSGARWVSPRARRGAAGIVRRQPLNRSGAQQQPVAPSHRAATGAGKGPATGITPSQAEHPGIPSRATDATGIQLPLQPADEAAERSETSVEGIAATLRTGTTPSHSLPALELLDKATEMKFTEADNQQRARLIEEALESYGVEAKVVQISPGPSVTQFGIEPGWVRKYKRVVERDPQGKVKLDKDGKPVERLEELSRTRVKVERITALANNLALALATPNIRIEAPVPGKPVVGIEVPNTTTSVVNVRGVIESPIFQRINARSKLALALGNGAAGEPVAADLTKMPHLLIAGTTGSGKTVCINSIITCLLMCNTPEDLRLLLIDPKRVELVSFNGVPHLISPVVVEVDKAIDALRRVIREMENRFNRFAAVGVRNIESYNKSQLVVERMPYLVVIVDELADLMMTAAEVVEPSICRLAQLARATGIHLILATQRPSVDVVTGLIKANFPTRISFAVASQVDSRTILDIGGAEKLLGQGDMLYVPPDAAKPKRLRGCFTSDAEIDRIVRFWKEKAAAYPAPDEDRVARAFAALETDEETKSSDPLLPTARRLARDHSHLSTSLLQRRLHIGYPRAARIMDELEAEGTVVRGDDALTGVAFDVDDEGDE